MKLREAQLEWQESPHDNLAHEILSHHGFERTHHGKESWDRNGYELGMDKPISVPFAPLHKDLTSAGWQRIKHNYETTSYVHPAHRSELVMQKDEGGNVHEIDHWPHRTLKE